MKDFIAIADYSAKELHELLDLAVSLKTEWKDGGNKPIFKNKVLAMVFQKPSLRTRVSFDMAMRHLGGDALYLSPAEIGLGKRESIADVAQKIFSRDDGFFKFQTDDVMGRHQLQAPFNLKTGRPFFDDKG